MSERRCIDNREGRPLCGAPAEGALLVDDAVNTTCDACLVRAHREIVTLRFHRAACGAPEEGFPLLELPEDATPIVLHADREVEGWALAAYVERGGAISLNGFYLIIRGSFSAPAGALTESGVVGRMVH